MRLQKLKKSTCKHQLDSKFSNLSVVCWRQEGQEDEVEEEADLTQLTTLVKAVLNLTSK